MVNIEPVLNLEQDTELVQDPNPVADRLYNHKIYHHYSSIHKEHLQQNPNSRHLKESTSPNLTGHVLRGENKINLRTHSLFVIDDNFLSECNDIDQLLAHQKNHSYTFFHLGPHLSGHSDIVHGGLLATLLDEVSCRLTFQNSKSSTGVTANLNVNYHKPCKTGSYIMIKCKVVKKSGRKCWVRGEVYYLELDQDFDILMLETHENLLSDSECLVIEPRSTVG